VHLFSFFKGLFGKFDSLSSHFCFSNESLLFSKSHVFSKLCLCSSDFFLNCLSFSFLLNINFKFIFNFSKSFCGSSHVFWKGC